MKNQEAALVCFICLLIGMVCGSLVVAGIEERRFELARQQAIEAGVAKYTINSKTGAVSFQYITSEMKTDKVILIPTEE